MDESILARIVRAQTLLKTAQNAAMATVNLDGSPHNTPFLLIHDFTMEYIYWGSHPESLHCQNALRTGQIFVVLYESNAGGGLYICANDSKILEGVELERGLAVHNEIRASVGKKPISLDYYLTGSSQRLFRAKTVDLYVNSAERDSNGYITRDYRHRITREQLQGQ